MFKHPEEEENKHTTARNNGFTKSQTFHLPCIYNTVSEGTDVRLSTPFTSPLTATTQGAHLTSTATDDEGRTLVPVLSARDDEGSTLVPRYGGLFVCFIA